MRYLAGLALLAALGLAGCGGGEKKSEEKGGALSV
jgi:uncharacterized lipoprotein YmbA